MSDLGGLFRRGLEGHTPSVEDGLKQTLRTVHRRWRWRQAAGGAVALGVFGTILAGAVLLQGARGRPVAGPTPTEGASPTVVLSARPGEPTSCSAIRGRYCLTRTSEIVEVASGVANGQRWLVQGYTVMYRGPDLRRYSPATWTGTYVELSMLCFRIQGADEMTPFCQRRHGSDSTWGFEAVGGAVIDPDLPPVRDLAGSSDDPLEGLEDAPATLFSTSVSGGDLRVMWVPEETASMEFQVDDGPPRQGGVWGPYPELRSDVRFLALFTPDDPQRLLLTGYTEGGDVLWREDIGPPTDP